MRLILASIYTLFALCLASSVAAKTDVQACLQDHLDAVLAGAPISEHADIKALSEFVLEATDTKKSLTIRGETTSLIAGLLSEKITKYGKKYRGTVVTIPATPSDSSSVAGRLTTPGGQTYRFTATLGSNCRITNLTIAKVFQLHLWIRNQKDFKALVRRHVQAS